MSEAMREQVRRDILAAYGVTAEEVELVDALLGGPQLRELERRYCEALPGRMAEAEREINDRFAGVLPEGMRFEWASSENEVP